MRYTKQEWFKTRKEMNLLFADIPEALANTAEIVDKVEDLNWIQRPLCRFFPFLKNLERKRISKRISLRKNFWKNLEKKHLNGLGGYEKVLRVKQEAAYLRHLDLYQGRKNDMEILSRKRW
jgi:DNA polymerase III subunit alpha